MRSSKLLVVLDPKKRVESPDVKDLDPEEINPFLSLGQLKELQMTPWGERSVWEKITEMRRCI